MGRKLLLQKKGSLLFFHPVEGKKSVPERREKRQEAREGEKKVSEKGRERKIKNSVKTRKKSKNEIAIFLLFFWFNECSQRLFSLPLSDISKKGPKRELFFRPRQLHLTLNSIFSSYVPIDLRINPLPFQPLTIAEREINYSFST